MEQLLKELIKWLARETCFQLGYLCRYKSYVEDLENEQVRLLAKVENVELKIEEAKKRNKNRVDAIVEEWLKRAKKLVQQDPEPTECFSICPNFSSRIARAKDLEHLINEQIPNLIAEVDKFDVIAHATGVPHMEFYSQEFMPFKSRMANFDELKEELEDENKYMIGLEGMGGTGKSTMAILVGKLVEKSNVFDRVMFISVSTPIDEKRIRDDIAKKLELQLEEEKLLTHAQQIWNRIASAGKVLIILDDVWRKLNLENIGIHHGIHNKGRCCVLLTTRYDNVCTQMRCQKRIKLDILDEKDALKLFLSHAMEIGHKCPNYLRKVAMHIVNECGKLPVIVVAVAKTLKDWPTEEWQDALTILKGDDEPLRHGIVDEDAMKFYNSLKLSYTHLKDKEAQVLFLLCSIFPKAHEIPVELLSRIAIGLGLFGEVDKYDTTRNQARVQKNKLLNSSLLLKANAECVKLHDVIRDVALEIAKEEIQVIMDSNKNLKKNMKYSSWIINCFPNGFDGSKLEVLLVWINAKGSLECPNAFFKGMKSLRVLILHSKIEFGRTSALGLPESIQSLQNVRTLSLKNWELGDISVLMKKCQKLESLELINCSIIELPNEINNLEKLRFLCLKSCSLETNNPFEVIARCSQLEELYYVANDDHIPIGPKVPQITSLPEYQIYHIDGSDFSTFDSSQLDTSIKRCFKPGKLKNIFSNEVIKSFAARAEILKLRGDEEFAGRNNLIPSIISYEDGAIGDLVKLSLQLWSKMKYLINTEHLQLKYGETFFSKLVGLQLVEVNVREICYGLYPDGFLEQLEKVELKKCQMLKSALFKGKLKLGNLKSIDIEDCSMTCLFHPSTAQSLRQLETLKIVDCSELKSIIGVEGSSMEKKVDKECKPRCHDDLMFPKLKLLLVKGCKELEFILPISFCEDLPQLESVEISLCKNLRYMFGQYYPEEEGLHEMQKETALHLLKVISIKDVPLFVNIYPECFLPQISAASTTNKDEPSSSKEADQPDHTSSREKYAGNIAQGIFTTPLYPCNLREMNIGYISNLSSSLFSVSIASSMLLLEQLVVSRCYGLKHIVIENVDGHNHMNANSIFPNLRAIEIKRCEKLEYVFSASCSLNLVHLESVHISVASRLDYVFGSSYGNANSPHESQNTEIHLPALNKLSLEYVSDMVSMCPENYQVKAPSLKDITLNSCPQLPINSLIDLSVEGHKGQEQLLNKKLMGMHLSNLNHLGLECLDMITIYDLERLETASLLNSCLETLRLEDLDQLTNICVGPKNFQLSFQNLSNILIINCPQLKFILSASMSRSLPSLRKLWVYGCKELESIIEEDDEEEEYWFPNLHTIIAKDCESLKSLFSISTCGKFPELTVLYISSAPELEQVFEWKQGATHDLKLDVKDVFPKLFMIYLAYLPRLHTICFAIDFHTVICCDVKGCPNISLTSTDNKFLYSYSVWLEKSESSKGMLDKIDLLEQRINRMRELAEKTINIKEMRDSHSSIEMAVEEKKKLIFFMNELKFQTNELLNASADLLGEGNIGKTYEAMLNGGASIVVKRLRNLESMTREDFAKQVHEIADMKHPNLLPLLGYCTSREEKLLLYRYAEKGTLFFRLHGNRGENRLHSHGSQDYQWQKG